MVLVTAAVGLEALLVIGYGVFLAVETAVAVATERLAAAVLAVMVVALGGGLAVLARSVLAGRRWARSPVLVWQVLQASVAVPALSTARWPVGVVLLVLCVAGLGVLRGDVLGEGRGEGRGDGDGDGDGGAQAPLPE